MASYVCLIQFKDQGIRNIQDTVKLGRRCHRRGILDNGRLRRRRYCGGTG
jgi:hypothetical protein